MKSKNKNSSFVSNHQLIEGLRKRSARSLPRNSSTDNTITLLQKKTYLHNDCMVENRSNNLQGEEEILIKKVRKHVLDRELAEEIEEAIRKDKEDSESSRKEKKQLENKQIQSLIKKIEQLYMDKNRLKKEKKVWEEKYREEVMNREGNEQLLRKENEKLHRLVMKQSDMICTKPSLGIEDMRRLLYLQAKDLESFF